MRISKFSFLFYPIRYLISVVLVLGRYRHHNHAKRDEMENEKKEKTSKKLKLFKIVFLFLR